MTGREIIDKILSMKGLNAKSFSEKIGLDRPQAIYDIQKGKTKAISSQLANKILSAFPEFSKVWLLTGEGPETNSAPIASIQTSLVPYEFVAALFEERKRHDEERRLHDEERKRHDEERKRHDEMNAELIRQHGSLISLIGENKKTVAQVVAVKNVVENTTGLQE